MTISILYSTITLIYHAIALVGGLNSISFAQGVLRSPTAGMLHDPKGPTYPNIRYTGL